MRFFLAIWSGIYYPATAVQVLQIEVVPCYKYKEGYVSSSFICVTHLVS